MRRSSDVHAMNNWPNSDPDEINKIMTNADGAYSYKSRNFYAAAELRRNDSR